MLFSLLGRFLFLGTKSSLLLYFLVFLDNFTSHDLAPDMRQQMQAQVQYRLMANKLTVDQKKLVDPFSINRQFPNQT
jgi:hypothetical protein